MDLKLTDAIAPAATFLATSLPKSMPARGLVTFALTAVGIFAANRSSGDARESSLGVRFEAKDLPKLQSDQVALVNEGVNAALEAAALMLPVAIARRFPTALAPAVAAGVTFLMRRVSQGAATKFASFQAA